MVVGIASKDIRAHAFPNYTLCPPNIHDSSQLLPARSFRMAVSLAFNFGPLDPRIGWRGPLGNQLLSILGKNGQHMGGSLAVLGQSIRIGVVFKKSQ